jgi:energy-coupling factor transport system ATP-binding protein
MIELINVSYVYNACSVYAKKALDGVSIKLNEKKIIGLVGRNGSGKSTLVQNLSNLLTPTSGELHVYNAKIGLVFQNPEQQIFATSVYEEIVFGLKYKDSNSKSKTRVLKKKLSSMHIDDNVLLKKVVNALHAVGLDETYLERSPFDLSGGEKRRVAIADIIVTEPDILILDEPTANLDSNSQINIMKYIKKIYQDNKIMIIIVSHDMNLIAELTEKTIVMSNGQISFYGNTYQAFRLAETDYNLPDVVVFANLLRERGIDVPVNMVHKHELINFLETNIVNKNK